MPNVMPNQPTQPQPMPNAMPNQPIQPQPMSNVMPNQPIQQQPMPNAMPNQPNPKDLLVEEQMANDEEIGADRMQSIEEQLSKTSQYNPEDLQQEKIVVPTDNQYEKNKFGLTFLIILFVILAVALALLPHITKFFS